VRDQCRRALAFFGDASQPIEVLDPHLRTFARTEPHVFADTAQPL
jgi:hypothetical protein